MAWVMVEWRRKGEFKLEVSLEIPDNSVMQGCAYSTISIDSTVRVVIPLTLKIEKKKLLSFSFSPTRKFSSRMNW